MKHHTLHRSVAVLAVAGVLAASCGDDDATDATTATAATAATGATTATGATGATGATTATGATAAGATTAPAGSGPAPGAVDLAGVCPDPLVIQTDWFPEAEHGALFQLIGEGYEVDADQKVVRGPLMAGTDETGIDVEVRAGGPAIGGTVAAAMYTDDAITLAYANTEAQVLQHSDTPMLSVMAPLEINPQIIYWDPETYPEIETLADLGEEGVTINVFGGGVFSEVFVGNGTWSADQVDPSYEGNPARFISEDGRIAQQGFASAEPYTYENTFEEWGKPLAYQTLHDAGFQAYSQTLAIRPDDLETLRPCLERVIPIVQQAAIDFVNDPDRAIGVIIDAVERFDTFWEYDVGLAEYSVATQLEEGFVGNGPDDTLGNMEEERIQTVIDQMRDDAGLDVPDDLEAADLFTNEFIDPDIGL